MVALTRNSRLLPGIPPSVSMREARSSRMSSSVSTGGTLPRWPAAFLENRDQRRRAEGAASPSDGGTLGVEGALKEEKPASKKSMFDQSGIAGGPEAAWRIIRGKAPMT